MQIADRGLVYKGPIDSDYQSAMMASMAVLESGRWACSFRAARTKAGTIETCLLCYSDDEGRTWSDPTMPWPVPAHESSPGRWRQAYLTATGPQSLIAVLAWIDDSDPHIAYWNEDQMTLIDTRICLSRSDDSGLTWSPPEFLDMYPIQLCTPLTGPMYHHTT